jgi:hypothetical protein
MNGVRQGHRFLAICIAPTTDAFAKIVGAKFISPATILKYIYLINLYNPSYYRRESDELVANRAETER